MRILFKGNNFQGSYYDELAEIAGLEKILPVMAKIYAHNDTNFNADLLNFRKGKYKIIDDNTFVLT